jgi:peroxiredoxin/outer membrane lipoprotein-sorting protein
MIKLNRVLALALLVGSLTYTTFAQEQKEAAELLKAVSDTYRSLTNYHFEGVKVRETGRLEMQIKTETRTEIPIMMAAAGPHKLRLAIRSDAINADVVSDGKTFWIYNNKTRRYLKDAFAPAGGTAKPEEGDGAVDVAEIKQRKDSPTRILQDYAELYLSAPFAKILRRETLNVGGKEIECDVVEIRYGGADKVQPDSPVSLLWIDKARRLVLKDVYSKRRAASSTEYQEEKVSTVFNVAEVGTPLPEQFFAFTPPGGAKELTGEGEEDDDSEAAELVGKDAADFSLKSLEGKTLDLKGLKGKVVLLSFWASWCPYCRIEMPALESLHRQYGKDGLVVLGVNDEDAATAAAYVKENGYTFATLLDTKKEVSKLYQVHLIPSMVIIGRDGKVVTYFKGAKSERLIREAVSKAGIGK